MRVPIDAGTEVKWSSFVATQGSSGGTELHSVELLADEFHGDL